VDTINENFIGKYIEDTYQKVLHIANDNTLANGTGSFVSTLRVGNLIFSGSDSIYLSFGNTEDSSGYGFRDINGILQFKNKSGS